MVKIWLAQFKSKIFCSLKWEVWHNKNKLQTYPCADGWWKFDDATADGSHKYLEPESCVWNDDGGWWCKWGNWLWLPISFDDRYGDEDEDEVFKVGRIYHLRTRTKNCPCTAKQLIGKVKYCIELHRSCWFVLWMKSEIQNKFNEKFLKTL